MLGEVDVVIEVSDELFMKFMDDVLRWICVMISMDVEVMIVFEELFCVLLLCCVNLEEVDWKWFVKVCCWYLLWKFVYEDLFMFCVYSKLRKYVGDVVMMDYIYVCEEFWFEFLVS